MNFLELSLVCLITLSGGQAAFRSRDLNKEFKQMTTFKPEISDEGSAPWQVSVQNQHGIHICGGAIIGNSVVLTAASCVAGLDKRDVRVITGSNSRIKSAATYEVLGIIIHCNYDKPLYHHNNVALIKLTTSILYNAMTQNITLANWDELEEGEILSTTEPDKSLSKQLQKSKFKYTSNEDCIKALGQHGADVDLGHLCAQPVKDSDDCHVDTGTPLVNAKGQLVGIGNWGLPCGHGFPDVFARVSFYSDWIRTSIKGCSLT